ncbi:hypothetical protein ABIE86_004486 [Bradyrhizobium diazoefficiens]
MQWGRGIFRLWIVLSALWLIVAGAFATADWRDHPMPVPPELCKDIEPNRVVGCEEGQKKGREQVTVRRQVTVAIVTVPPLAVLLIGIGLGWGGSWLVSGRPGQRPPRTPGAFGSSP